MVGSKNHFGTKRRIEICNYLNKKGWTIHHFYMNKYIRSKKIYLGPRPCHLQNTGTTLISTPDISAHREEINIKRFGSSVI